MFTTENALFLEGADNDSIFLQVLSKSVRIGSTMLSSSE